MEVEAVKVFEVEENKVSIMGIEKVMDLVKNEILKDENDFIVDKIEEEKIIIYHEQKVGSIIDIKENNEVNKIQVVVEKEKNIVIIIDCLDFEEH